MAIRPLPSRQFGSGYPGDLDGWASDVDAQLRGGGSASLPTNTLLDVNVGTGDGLYVAQAITGGTFATVLMPTKTTDTANGWNTTTGIYTVPATGTYLVIAKFRPVDDASPGRNIGIGVHTSNADNPNFVWGTQPTATSGRSRDVRDYQRVAQFTVGDQLRLFCYVANGGDMNMSAASMQIIRLA